MGIFDFTSAKKEVGLFRYLFGSVPQQRLIAFGKQSAFKADETVQIRIKKPEPV